MYKHFSYAPNVYGGTEYMAKTFHNSIMPMLSKLDNYNCVIMPGMIYPLENYLKNGKGFLIWMHNTPSQFNQEVYHFFNNPLLRERLKYIIVPSQSHKEIVNLEINIPLEKIYVIPNAIHPAESDLSRFEKPKKVKLVFTSAADRGLSLLLDALGKIENDYALEIYNDFYPDLVDNFPSVDPRIKFFGRTPKKTVLSALSEAHIFAYPTTFIETFCLSLAEAMSAGLLPIYPDYGSLKEISGGRGEMYEYEYDVMKHTDLHAEKLDTAINKIKAGEWDPTEQIQYINDKYSWESITKQWLKFEELI